MKNDNTRGYVIIGAIGLLWFTLATKTPATWHGADLLILTLTTSILTPYVLGLLRTVGLGRITDFALDAIGYYEEQQFKSWMLWNKIWVRSLPWWLAFFLVKKYTGWGSLVFMAYAGWAIFRHYRRNAPQTIKIDPKQGGFVFQTGDGPLWLANPYRGTFINGGPGSGKSKSLVEPIIQQAGAQGLTGLVYDFKFPTLAQDVAGSYAGTDVTPYYVNFTDVSRSHRINPVAPRLLSNVSQAREAALTVLSNLDVKAAQQRSFWIQSAEVLLTGSIWYLRNNHPQYCTLPHAVSLLLESDPRRLIEVLRQDDEVRPIIASVSSGVGSDNQLAGVFSTVQNYLSALVSPAIYWVLSGDDVPFDLNSPQKPAILTVGNDPTLTGTFSPLISLIVSTALKRMNTPGQRPSVVILDEAPTLFIPNFQQLPATGRSNKIATVYAVQDISQMVGAFGRETSEMILGSLSNQFFGRSTTPEVAERVSRMFGRYDQEYTGRSVSHSDNGTSFSQSRNVQQRDRLEAQAVMRFEQGEFAGILAEGSHAEFRRYFAAPDSQAQLIKPFKQVSETDTRQQFSRIKDQVNQILATTGRAQEAPVDAPRSEEQTGRRSSTAQADERAAAAPNARPDSPNTRAQPAPRLLPPAQAQQPDAAQPEPEDWQNFM
ncbi:type IV secretory system conjugative DNA transfer family protein [Rudanella lutea]|uniref:type IV secretory system conjugative DNA transfer family protein n=1 Tax=Rudanella lutea TaxID=451374 RepID=UPI00037CD0DD|nr:TraM recognition domain-containing protein [Rudanella lutea]